ncbi:MAG: HDOD domain-containing protein [Gammaproteobacteria bacterium]
MLVEGMVDLAPLPQAYVRLREMVDDPLVDLNDVAQVVSSDPALTGRVLRLVNSAYIGLMAPVETIEHAVRVLGMQQVHDMALATSAIGSLSKLRGDLFDIFAFWRLSIYAAGSAKEVSMRLGLASPQRMFVCGLLHNIGNLVIAHEMPQGYTDCRKRAAEVQRPWFELQREMFGFDYAEVGAELMQRWCLPDAIIRPVLQHTRPVEALEQDEQALTAVMSVAATTARAASYQSPESEPVPDYDPVALNLVGLDADGIETLMSQVDDAIVESLAVLLPDY